MKAVKNKYLLNESAKRNLIYSVKGWVRTFRANRFIALNDGSTIENLQCVIDYENIQSNDLKKINTGAPIQIIGILSESQGSKLKVAKNSHFIK